MYMISAFICDVRQLYKSISFQSLLWPNALCRKKFNVGEMTYICLDCRLAANAVMCAECFSASEHINHRYQERSDWSGYCDCGADEAFFYQATCDTHKVCKVS
jgi:hypothetical protein